jgi:putative OPT family oligopeptide transporter
MQDAQKNTPFIPAYKSLPEITLKGTLLAIILTVVLAAANAFLGLKVGMTVSASIPAAVISMGVLQFFKRSNILENNIVQTAASAGEALTGGIAFTLPALIVIHYWNHFNYWPTFFIAFTGGALGVLFSVPLRRILLDNQLLKFPEGTAIANVLMANSVDNHSLNNLVFASGVGGFIALCQTGFKFFADHLQLWCKVGTSIVGMGFGFSPALIGAGYIIGPNACTSIFIGIILGWIIGVPVLSHVYGIPLGGSAGDTAMLMWTQHIRYIGLGTMMVGGFWAVIALLNPILKGVRASILSLTQKKRGSIQDVLRTEKDLSMIFVLWSMVSILVPIYFLLNHFVTDPHLHLSQMMIYALNGVALLLIFILGFAVASVCGYFAGLVGSSANPLSSMALIALMIVSLVLLLFFGHHVHVEVGDLKGTAIGGIAIMMTAVIASTATICNDTIQDLKAGQLVGATPWKQQVMLILGVFVSALSIPLILQLLFNAYGLAGVMPHPNMNPTQMLLAPQAGLMAAIVDGIFTRSIAWQMLLIGAVIALCVLILDFYLEKQGKARLPVLAVGIGIYLPTDASMSLVIGGFLFYIVERFLVKKYQSHDVEYRQAHQAGLLLASGLVAGAAIMGVLLAIPFVIEGSSDALRLMPLQYEGLSGFFGFLAIMGLCLWFASRVLKPKT